MAADTAADVTRRLIGNWKLVKYETFDQNGAVRPGRYIGYFGPFTVDAQKRTVTHHVIGSSYPHWLGTEQVRYYGFSDDGNQLTLSVKAGERVTATLTWVRVK
ncbi:MAG: lipocalin-like domain-containing protein [Acidobacteria bacterium]|nr:lipocalin-like domain-containing protein [Acidobacteriota bacterium]